MERGAASAFIPGALGGSELRMAIAISAYSSGVAPASTRCRSRHATHAPVLVHASPQPWSNMERVGNRALHLKPPTREAPTVLPTGTCVSPGACRIWRCEVNGHVRKVHGSIRWAPSDRRRGAMTAPMKTVTLYRPVRSGRTRSDRSDWLDEVPATATWATNLLSRHEPRIRDADRARLERPR
jgi:hypothetical protein